MGARISSGPKSNQTYATPPEFIEAVHRQFGLRHFGCRDNLFHWDLAADAQNTKGEMWYDEQADSLKQDWEQLTGMLWLNPPFDNIGAWAKKCYESTRTPGRIIFFLVPASVGANWYRDWVHRKADVYFLNARISFDGKNAYPKDCMLCVYGGMIAGESVQAPQVWNWVTGKGW